MKSFKRRSLLFIPAIRPDFFDKIPQLNCDTIIFDLEDSVPLKEKHIARENLINNLDRKLLNGKEFAVRINSADSAFFNDDIKSISRIYPETIVLPKVNGIKDIQILKKEIVSLKINTQIIPIIETVEGLLNADKSLTFCDHISAVAFGAEDFCMEMKIEKGILKDNHILTNAMFKVIYLAKMYQIQYIDCVFTGYGTRHNLVQLKSECEYMKRMGADGKLIIHPTQIEIANEIFGIDKSEIFEAKRIISEFEKSGTGRTAVISDKNKMMDLPSFKYCSDLLDKAKKQGYID